MSYVRWSNVSKVYAFKDVSGGYTCKSCAHLQTLPEFAVHMRRHVERGEAPAWVMERIDRELAEAKGPTP